MLSNIQDSESYEYLILQRDIYKKQIEESLDIVKKFIIKKKLIITGGMAIDLALKSKGSQLYTDKVLPDYDFYSPDFHTDAYSIGVILCKMGIDDVSVINALHSTTMRVRINNKIPVADITYIPKVIYNKIPTMVHTDGRIFEHPHYKMINLHIALSYPFANVPTEVILQRYAKDIKRFDLLNKYFPIVETFKNKLKSFKPKFVSYELPLSVIKDTCLSGFIGLAHWMNLEKIKIPIVKKGKINISILSDNPKDTEEKISKLFKQKAKYYNPILDNPSKTVIDNIEILDNRGKLVSATDKKNFYLANLQFIMAQFLTDYFLETDDIMKKNYMWGYVECFNLVKNASEKKSKNPKSTEYDNYLPTIDTYGKHNIEKAHITSRDKLLFNIDEISRKTDRPVNIYPKLEEKCAVHPKVKFFKLNKSWIYNIDGSERNIPAPNVVEL